MKTLVKTIALVLLSSSLTLSAFAKDIKKPKEEKSFEVAMYFDHHSGTIKTFFEKEKGSQLELVFMNKDEQELSRAFANKKCEKGRVFFDINALPNGTYTIKASSGKEVSLHTLKITQPELPKKVKFN
ncbi:MAG: hypothetical protein NXI00_09370 [Cytophagales bacterium]|nr:hypothetical protein [Cytophagales bacterium]